MNEKSNLKSYRFLEIAENIVERTMPQAGDEETYIGLEHIDSGCLHITRWGSATELVGEKLKMKKGDVLFGRRNAYLKRAAIAPFDGIFSAHGMVFRPHKDVICEEFFPFFILSDYFMERAIQISVGSLSPTVNWGNLKNEEFYLPPIEEQRHIAELLWAADDLIEKYKKTFSDLNTVQSCYIREMDAIISEENDTISFSDCVDFTSGQVDPKNEPYASMSLVAPNHIESNTGKVIAIETAAQQNAISGKYLFSKGDVVYSKIRPALCKAFLAEFDGLCSADMYPLRPHEGKLRNGFLLQVLLGPRFTEYANTCSVRTSIPKLNRKDMGAFKFHLPSIDYQDSFMKKHAALEAQKITLNAQINNVTSLLQKILNGVGGV